MFKTTSITSKGSIKFLHLAVYNNMEKVHVITFKQYMLWPRV